MFYHKLQEKRDDLINPYWIEDPDLKKGEVDFLTPAETSFWKDLIDKYLYPIDANKEEEVKQRLKFVDAPLRIKCVCRNNITMGDKVI